MPTCTDRCRLRIISAIASRLSPEVLFRIAQAAIAAGVSWELARLIPGHTRPFFAPIAAVIALGADPGRRARQATELLLGVVLGILLGAGLVAVIGIGGWQLVVGVAVALVLATALGAKPMIRNQAAVSVVLVVALHQPGTNIAVQRLVDSLVGGGVAIVMARFLFPTDPVALVEPALTDLRTQLAAAITDVADALESRDPERVEQALVRIDEVDVKPLQNALALARQVVRRAPRRRRQSGEVEALAASAQALVELRAETHAMAAAARNALP